MADLVRAIDELVVEDAAAVRQRHRIRFVRQPRVEVRAFVLPRWAHVDTVPVAARGGGELVRARHVARVEAEVRAFPAHGQVVDTPVERVVPVLHVGAARSCREIVHVQIAL